jgi:hypothetical protein
MLKQIIIGTVLALLNSQLIHTAPAIDTLLSPEVKTKLLSEELLTAAHFDNLATSYSPADARLISAIEEIKAAVKPNILIESLCYYKKPASSSEWNEEERVKLLNGISSLSTLAGLTYYSPSRKKTLTFYETSSIIDSPQNKQKLPDPFWTKENLPDSITLYAAQKDLTFGDNIYKFDFTIEGDAIFFYQRNVTTLYYGIIPVLGKEKLCSIVALINTDEAVLIYMASMADAVSFPGMKNRVAASFSARSAAVLAWFNSKADAIYRK